VFGRRFNSSGSTVGGEFQVNDFIYYQRPAVAGNFT
jgi:hypothetical protein